MKFKSYELDNNENLNKELIFVRFKGILFKQSLILTNQKTSTFTTKDGVLHNNAGSAIDGRKLNLYNNNVNR